MLDLFAHKGQTTQQRYMNIVAQVPMTLNIWLTKMSLCEYCKQIASTCNKQMNFATLCTDIQFALGYCIATAPDPARDYWCANHSTETQAT